MKPLKTAIVPLKRPHLKACEAIVAASDPWKRLNEGVDFLSVLTGRRTNTRAYVCVAGAEPAGFVLFIPDPVFARGGYLRAIGVSPKFRRQGIGKKLLSFAEKMTARRSFHLFLCASSFNRRAQAFYRGCGYVRVGRLPDLIKPGVSEYIFWKRLRRRSS